jgi:hypothetical protein
MSFCFYQFAAQALDTFVPIWNKKRTKMEVPMNRADEVAKRALALVAASRAMRERHEQQRREVYERVQIAALRKPRIPKGIQLRLNLQ